MSFLDFFLLLIIAGFGLFGFWFGLIHTFGSLIGTIAGAIIASQTFEAAAGWLKAITDWSDNACRVIMFIIIFFTVNRLIGVLFWMVERTTKILQKIPQLQSLNRFLGAMLGLFEGVLTVGIALYFMLRFPTSDATLDAVASSRVYKATEHPATTLLVPFIPETLQAIDNAAGEQF